MSCAKLDAGTTVPVKIGTGLALSSLQSWEVQPQDGRHMMCYRGKRTSELAQEGGLAAKPDWLIWIPKIHEVGGDRRHR